MLVAQFGESPVTVIPSEARNLLFLMHVKKQIPPACASG